MQLREKDIVFIFALNVKYIYIYIVSVVNSDRIQTSSGLDGKLLTAPIKRFHFGRTLRGLPILNMQQKCNKNAPVSNRSMGFYIKCQHR